MADENCEGYPEAALILFHSIQWRLTACVEAWKLPLQCSNLVAIRLQHSYWMSLEAIISLSQPQHVTKAVCSWYLHY